MGLASWIEPDAHGDELSTMGPGAHPSPGPSITDPALSRWWLVKWFLPSWQLHCLVLLARCRRGGHCDRALCHPVHVKISPTLFDFTVGASCGGAGGLPSALSCWGTDRYPPFSLQTARSIRLT